LGDINHAPSIDATVSPRAKADTPYVLLFENHAFFLHVETDQVERSDEAGEIARTMEMMFEVEAQVDSPESVGVKLTINLRQLVLSFTLTGVPDEQFELVRSHGKGCRAPAAGQYSARSIDLPG
jgi:hypothetical protein